MNATETFGQICAYQKRYSGLRFVLISLASCMASVGLIWNVKLSTVFLKRQSRLGMATLHLGFLAILDAILCLMYVFLFGVEAAAYYLRFQLAYELLFVYLVPCFILSRIVQVAIPYMLILATLQRWLGLSTNSSNKDFRFQHLQMSSNWTGVICAIITIICICCRIPMAFAFNVMYYPNCSDFLRTKELWATEFYSRKGYYIFDIYIMNSIQIFVPFVTLLILNAIIVIKLRSTRLQRQRSINHLGRARRHAAVRLVWKISCKADLRDIANIASSRMELQLRDDASRERNAISMMAVIVASYLICNSFNVVLTVLEQMGVTLATDSWSEIYLIASDIINFLFMFCSVIRFLIYYKFSPEIRFELKYALRRFSETSELCNIIESFRTPPAHITMPIVSNALIDSAEPSIIQYVMRSSRRNSEANHLQTNEISSEENEVFL